MTRNAPPREDPGKDFCPHQFHVLHAAKIFPPPFGGIETVLDHLVRGLVQIEPNMKIDVLATHSGRRSHYEHGEGRICVDRIRSIGQIARTPVAPSYRHMLKNSEADLFHFHFPYPWAELSLLLSGINKPYIVSYHSDIVKQKRLLKLWKPFMGRFLSGASRIVVASPHVLETSPFLQGQLAKKTEVIPYGIDTDRFLPSNESITAAQALHFKLASSGPLLFFLGRLVYYKGVQTLIEAMREIDASLVIGGQGPLEGDLKRLVQEYGLNSKITFAGSISPDILPLYYQAADLFVLPSTDTSEAFGMVMLEAHASGTPVVSTNLPTGVVFVNQHQTTGLCVETRDPLALRKGIQTLLQNPELRATMGATAQNRARRQFDTRVMCQSYLSLYREVLNAQAT